MRIDEFQGKMAGKEVWLVADGLSCPDIEFGGHPIIAVNHAYKNVRGELFGIIYQDAYFRKHLQEDISDKAKWVFRSAHSGKNGYKNDVEYRSMTKRTGHLRDGIYVGQDPDRRSAGVAAVSLAIGMGAAIIRLFGFDYRLFEADESRKYFNREPEVHRSDANHRRTEFTNVSRNLYNKKIASFDQFLPERDRIFNHSLYSNLYQFQKVCQGV